MQGFDELRWFGAMGLTLLQDKAPYLCEPCAQLFDDVRAVPALEQEAAPHRLHQALRIIPLHAAIEYVANGLFEVLFMVACFLAMNQAAHNSPP